jgi:hypothetical protein
MKKLFIALITLAMLLLTAGSVLAGGDKVQMQNPGYNLLDESDHNEINHCFRNIED